MASVSVAEAEEPGVSVSPPSATLEIRGAQPQEREAAWELQRGAFGLSDPVPPPHPGHADDLRVVMRDGRLVSCLTTVRAELHLSGARVSMGGIRHVATHPEEQNRGYGSALMRSTLEWLREQGVACSILFPFSFRYYRKFGYELGGNHCHTWCRPSSIPAYEERRRCRRAGVEDCEALFRLYDRRHTDAACALVRDPRRWRRICAAAADGIVVYDRDGIRGYAVTQEERDSYGGRMLRVLELDAETPDAWRGLTGYLSQVSAESVEWLARPSDLAASGVLRSPAPLREGFRPRSIVTVRPMFQVRVVDLPSALRVRASSFPPGPYTLCLRIQDELLPQNSAPLTIEASARGAEVRPARPSDPSLEADVRTFSQLLCGYVSPSEAASQGLARASSMEALETAERLFPAGEPFLSELDRF